MFGLFKQANQKIEFTKEYFNVLKKSVPALKLISLKELEITTEFQENEHKHFLGNAFNEYINDEDSKLEIIKRYIESSINTYYNKTTYSINEIVPIIKSQKYLDELIRITNSEEIDLVYEKYNSELFIFYAMDSETSISYIQQEDQVDLELPLKDFKELSIENLINKVSIKKYGKEGSYMLSAGGDFEASLILVKSLWDKANFNVDGDIIISIPSKDVILITGSNNTKGIEELKKQTEEIFNSSNYTISNSLFILKDEEFVNY
ncbi:DUF1444 family protein [Flammeovirga agarivorans]|uniref:DUF1444 family protein n=1 Tax=Flammeovirga agarivorans TaxID=2726742 RepID=A0A7X8XZE4_9BACT|nr:DUF1444 family protein [Flammeovirga agarivorans]NLR95116.1 DUF1444 family protein [Flammeovirga agarivorans]